MMKSLLFILLSFIIYAQTPAETPEAAAHQPGDMRTDSAGIEQVWVPAGCFLMGTTPDQIRALFAESPPAWVRLALPNEQPQHEVCLTEGYWIDRYEVTHAAFQAFVDDGGYTKTEYWSERGQAWLSDQDTTQLPVECVEVVDDQPRVCVTWYEAEAYAHWRGGSLPTEAQWEFAARGPESLVYPWGNEWDGALANVVDSTELTPVGSYPEGASWVGALDMAGNAMEWVQDWLGKKYYESSPHDDPPGPETGVQKVEKGGWWGSNLFVARGAYRHYEDPPTYQDHHIGFRVVSVEE